MNAQDRERIGQIIQERNIKFLFHFTPVDNLDYILHLDLQSRANIEKNPDVFGRAICLDNDRADKRRNGICLSIEFPNHFMFYSHRMKFDKNWAIIVLDINLILEIENRQIQFFSTNSAYKGFRNIDDKWLESADAFESLFSDTVENKRDGILHRPNNLPLRYPTDVQAEVMVASHIETKYIKGIIFDNQEIANQYNEYYNGEYPYNQDNPLYKFNYDKKGIFFNLREKTY